MATISLRNSWPLLALFVAIVMGVGFVVGLISSPDAGRSNSSCPLLYCPTASAPRSGSCFVLPLLSPGWRLWLIDSASFETRLWLAILILSWWYYPVFFVARAPSPHSS